MLQKIGFAIPCGGHFIQEFRHKIETDQGTQYMTKFVTEDDAMMDRLFATLEEAQVWCKANPKQPKK